MGVRLRSEAGCFYGESYMIEIIDTNYSGAVVSFITDLKKAEFPFNGSPKDRLKIINTSGFSFNLLIEDDDHLLFWQDMQEEQEGRFYVKVYTDYLGSYDLCFAGHLVLDESLLPNTNVKRWFNLNASDGLFRLTEQEYKSDSADQTNAYGNNINYYEGMDTFKNIIFKCLDGLGVQDLYDATDDFLLINENWYESQMSSMSGVSSLEWVRTNQRIFTQKDEEENYTTMSRADVLKAVLGSFGCRITYVWGKYIIDNLRERGKLGRIYRSYDKNGNHISNATVSKSFTIDNDTGDYLALAGGAYGLLPALKQSYVNFSFTLGNYGYVPNYWSNTESTLISLGDVEVTSEDTALFVGCGVTFKTTALTAASNAFAYLYWGITIKFGSYYYITEVTQETYNDFDDNGAPITESRDVFTDKWSTTPGTYLLRSDKYKIDQLAWRFGEAIIEITTLPLRQILDPDPTPAYSIGDVDELSIKVEYIGLRGEEDYTTNYDSEVGVEWQTWSVKVEPREGSEAVKKTQSTIKYFIDNNPENSTTAGIDTIIGDAAFNSNNRIEVYNGTSWVGSTGSWASGSIPAAGTGQQLQELLAEEIMRGQNKTIQRYVGSFRGIPDPSYLLLYDSITWVHNQFTFRPYDRVLDGEWYEYRYDDLTSFTIDSQGVVVEAPGGSLSVSGGAASSPQVSNRVWPVIIQGAGSKVIDLSDYPLPDPNITSQGQINYLLNLFRGSLRLWYGSNAVSEEYTLNFSTGEMTLGRALRSDEYIRGEILEILS